VGSKGQEAIQIVVSLGGGGEEKFYEKKRCRGRRQNASLERTDDECERFYVIERGSDHTRGGVRETTFGKRAKRSRAQKHETTTEREKKGKRCVDVAGK
jgi:hypothetical protein